jgi:transcription initiation factor TFIID TATA-box-binding protein
MNDLEFSIVNAVGSGKVDEKIDLEELKKSYGDDKEYQEAKNNQDGIIRYFDNPRPLAITYKSGSYTIIGKSREDVEKAKDRLVEEVKGFGPEDNSEFSIVNLVGRVNLGKRLNLNSLMIKLGLEHSEYNPEQFPALVYSDDTYNCTFLIFSTGKIMVSGGTHKDNIKKQLVRFTRKVKNYDNLAQ